MLGWSCSAVSILFSMFDMRDITLLFGVALVFSASVPCSEVSISGERCETDYHVEGPGARFLR